MSVFIQELHWKEVVKTGDEYHEKTQDKTIENVKMNGTGISHITNSTRNQCEYVSSFGDMHIFIFISIDAQRLTFENTCIT